jgi:hypothetical protein
VGLIVDVATVLGALATVLGVAIALRGRSRSDRGPVAAGRGQSSFQRAGLDAAHIEIDTALETLDNLLVVDSATHAAWVQYEQRVSGAMSSEEFGRMIERELPRLRRGAVVQRQFMFVDEAHGSKTAPRTSWSMGLRASWPGWPARRSRPAVTASIPTWATSLMPAADARRYAWEWGAHLYQLIEEGQLRQARRDRRVLALAGLLMAVALRARRALSWVR